VLTLPTPLDPLWAGYPPHMSALDYPIWKTWAPSQSSRWHALYFDVALGPGADTSAAPDAAHAAMWTRLTQKRADVVADAGDHWELIELRHAANANALGRLLLYQHLWIQDPPDTRPLKLILVTDHPDPDIAPLLPQHNITYVVT
jgi:hypothetical protein